MQSKKKINELVKQVNIQIVIRYVIYACLFGILIAFKLSR